MNKLIAKVSALGLSTLLIGGFSYAQVSNDNTGYDSENNATIEQMNGADIEVANDAHVDNSVDGMLKTGFNYSSYNTGDGMVDSGDAVADIEVDTLANESVVDLHGDAMSPALPNVGNDTTGALSENNAWMTLHNEMDVVVDNNACVENDVNVLAYTGGNKSSYNTGSGQVSTGDASMTVRVINTLNSSEVMTH